MPKNQLLNCKKCTKLVVARAKDFEQGYVVCSHFGCGYKNMLNQNYYDPNVLLGLPSVGKLVYEVNPNFEYSLKVGINAVGHLSACDVHVERFLHSDKCYISRRHCTIEVVLDKWSGRIRYILQDGVYDHETRLHKNSLNGTFLNGYKLKEGEKIDIPTNGLVNLGGMDNFKLDPCVIPDAVLSSYLISSSFDPDQTQ